MTSIRDDIAKALYSQIYEVNNRQFQVSGWLHDDEDVETGQRNYFLDIKYLDNGEHERISLTKILENSRNVTDQVKISQALYPANSLG